MDSAMVWKENYANDEEEIYLLKVILSCAIKLDDKNKQAYALRHICRAAYNNFDPEDLRLANNFDTVQKYCDQLEALNLNTTEYKKFLCDAKSYLCYTFINLGKTADVLSIASEMLNDNSAGAYSEITAYELMGQTFMILMQYDKASDSFEKAYKLCKDDKENLKYQLHLCLLLCDVYVAMGAEKKLKPCIADLERSIKEMEDNGEKDLLEERNHNLLCAYKLGYYLSKNDMGHAESCVKEFILPLSKDDFYANQVASTMLSRYYLANNDLDQAWAFVSDFKYTDISYHFYLEQQVKVLKAQGQYEEALNLQTEIYNIQKEKYDVLYASQLTDLEVKHNILKLEKEKAGKDTAILILVIAFSVVIIILLSYMYRRSLTDKKKLEKAKQKVDLANATQKSFLQNMSHEIRTPLNAICGFSQLVTNPEMREFIDDEEMINYGKIIRSNTDMLTTLVNDILDVSDMNSGKYRLNFTEFSVNEICRNAISTVSYRCPDHIKLYMTSDVDDDFLIRTDSQRSCQIIINYLTNAIKHTFDGEIHVHCSLSENPGYLAFSVTDTGEGIPIEKAEVIFGRFEKLDTFKQGTGLGLAICRTLARLMGGDAMLDTSYSGGARFIYTHPLENSDSETATNTTNNNQKENDIKK